jgi:16S rRNA (adenine1518-N6/adenine1519-N6)-dimethyltransferase
LTSLILEKNPKSLTLVELDKDMIEILNDRIKNDDLDIKNISKFEIVNQDVLKVEPELSDYKVIANIPYYITSPILFKFLYKVENKPREMIILMQKEV